MKFHQVIPRSLNTGEYQNTSSATYEDYIIKVMLKVVRLRWQCDKSECYTARLTLQYDELAQYGVELL